MNFSLKKELPHGEEMIYIFKHISWWSSETFIMKLNVSSLYLHLFLLCSTIFCVLTWFWNVLYTSANILELEGLSSPKWLQYFRPRLGHTAMGCDLNYTKNIPFQNQQPILAMYAVQFRLVICNCWDKTVVKFLIPTCTSSPSQKIA